MDLNRTTARHTFTRRADGIVIVCARQGIVLDMFRDDRHLDVIAAEWLAEWA